MNMLRRAILGVFAADLVGRHLSAHAQTDGGATVTSDILPRHVLCFLGDKADLSGLQAAAAAAIKDFAVDFEIDRDFSQAEADGYMQRSFDICWDRVDPYSHSDADMRAVAAHKAVLYVLGPPMQQSQALDVSLRALRLIGRMIDGGGIAVKGESAGIAYGIDNWKSLIAKAETAVNSGDRVAQMRIARLALSRRPISQDGYYNSVGFHLVGLPDVFVPVTSDNELELVAMIDTIADEMASQGVAATLASHKAELVVDRIYEEDEFKHNPYGHVKLPR